MWHSFIAVYFSPVVSSHKSRKCQIRNSNLSLNIQFQPNLIKFGWIWLNLVSSQNLSEMAFFVSKTIISQQKFIFLWSKYDHQLLKLMVFDQEFS